MLIARSCCSSPTVCAAPSARSASTCVSPRERPTSVRSSSSRTPAAGVPYIRPRRFCCAGPPGRSLKLSDSIVPEALLSDGQEFVRVSRSSALIQMKAEMESGSRSAGHYGSRHFRDSAYAIFHKQGSVKEELRRSGSRVQIELKLLPTGPPKLASLGSPHLKFRHRRNPF